MSIVVRSLTYIHPDGEVLFNNISLSVQKGEKASLVGKNGAGKSCLLKIVAGNLPAGEGEIILPDRPYYVPQHLGQFDGMLLTEALGIHSKLTALHAILSGDVSEQNLSLLNDDWEIEDRMMDALRYWKIQHLDVAARMKILSGGEKTKVLLAGMLIHSPEIVLLDEPTNHLDFRSRSALYDYITQSRSTMLIASHDRSLLNRLDMTIELSRDAAELYGGNYAFYREQKDLKMQSLQSKLSEKERDLKQIRQKAREVAEQKQKHESRGKTQKMKQGMPRIAMGRLKDSAEQSAAKLNADHAGKASQISEELRQIRQQIQTQQVLKIDIRSSDLHKGKVLVKAEQVNVCYNDRELWLYPLTFQLYSGDRMHILGDNGSGKTSLVHLITRRLAVSSGNLYTADFSYLYVDQEYSVLRNELTVFEQVSSFNERQLPEHDLKMLLHYHQFANESWERPCFSLSGGERMKLLLCCLVVSDNIPDLLILDEPTNNLDVLSQEILSEAVRSYNGTLLVISHDPFFVDRIGVDKSIHLIG